MSTLPGQSDPRTNNVCGSTTTHDGQPCQREVLPGSVLCGAPNGRGGHRPVQRGGTMPRNVADAPAVTAEMFQLDDLVADGLHSEIRKAEFLSNGYVRVEDTAGLVRLWERLATGDLFRRSGYGECSDERRRVHQMFTNAPAWIA